MIWAFFIVLAFAILGGMIVFRGKAPELLVGFLIGVSSMLAQLFFVLAVITFGLGTEATTNGYGKHYFHGFAQIIISLIIY